MTRSYMHAPLDPECPEVARQEAAILNDPMTHAYGMGDEIMEGFARKHRASNCDRCREYGAANIEVR